MVNTTILRAFSDNYIYVVHIDKAAIVIDPGVAQPVFDFIHKNKLVLKAVLLTHNHSDHTGGAKKLKKETGCVIVGAKGRGVDEEVCDNKTFTFCDMVIKAIEVPGHTDNDLSYYIHEIQALFTGDTLFACGCGRIFDGTATQMHRSLQTLASYPNDTNIYCGHEYTEENCEFALTIDPENTFLQKRLKAVKMAIMQGVIIMPSTLKEEKTTNPFLRSFDSSIRKTLGMESASDEDVFAEIRKRKDSF